MMIGYSCYSGQFFNYYYQFEITIVFEQFQLNFILLKYFENLLLLHLVVFRMIRSRNDRNLTFMKILHLKRRSNLVFYSNIPCQ